MLKRIQQGLGTAIQVLLLIGIWWGMQWLGTALHLPIPAGVLGLFFVLMLLLKGWVPIEKLKRGALWLLAEMLLFFIPAALAVIQYPDMMRQVGWKILVVITLSTTFVMMATAWIVEGFSRWKETQE